MRPSILAVAAVAAASLALGACGTGDADESSSGSAATGSLKTGPGVDADAKTIRVGDLNALSGPAAALGKPVVAGHQAYFDALNARGGIDGWEVELAVEDTGYQPQQHVQAYNALKGDIAILNSFGSPTTKAIQPQFQREKLVTVPASFDSIWGTDPTVAPVGTPYSIDVANALDYATDGGAKPLKVGIIYQNDEYGADGLRGFEAAQHALGFTDVGRQSYKPGDTDFTAQVQKLKAAGAEAVVVTALPSATGPIVGTAATLGFTPQWILQGPSYIEQLITEDGTAKGKPTPVAPVLKGAIVTSFSAPWGSDEAPGMEQLLADQQQYAPDQTPSIYFALAYSQGMVVEQILRKAIESGDLTRDGILAAKENLGEVDLGGITPAVTYTPEGGPPSRNTLITEIDPSVPGFLKVVEPAHASDVGEAIDISQSTARRGPSPDGLRLSGRLDRELGRHREPLARHQASKRAVHAGATACSAAATSSRARESRPAASPEADSAARPMNVVDRLAQAAAVLAGLSSAWSAGPRG